MLIIDEGVVSLFRVMMQMPSASKVFIHNCDPLGAAASVFVNYGCKVTASCVSEQGFYKYHKSLDYSDPKRVEVVHHNHQDMIKPQQEFQFAFGFPHFTDEALPIVDQDILRQWQVSKSTPGYTAPRHLMGLEALHASVLPGGFFGAITPRHWMGKYMKFMKYWQSVAPQVAKIELPRKGIARVLEVTDEDLTPELLTLPPDQRPEYLEKLKYYDTKPLYTGKWYLMVWQKPVEKDSVKRSNRLHFATMRYSSHIGALRPMDIGYTGLEPEAVEYCAGAFRKSDWSKYSVRAFSKCISDSQDQYGTEYGAPPIVRSPKDMRILKVSDKNKPSFVVKETVDEIKHDPLAVHIKTGPPTKLYAYSPAAQGILRDLRYKAGFSREELQLESNSSDYRARDEFTVRLKTKTFSDDRDWLLKLCCEAGLRPYLTASDHSRLVREERWLSIQLTPIARTIRAQSPDNGEEWETVYDDVDIKATFPEIWNLWESRARKMKLHLPKFSYGFQYEDIVTMACKQSVMNTNVMGLGKTRESLFSILLRGTEKSLLVIPTRLVGVWQEEIETTITEYCRLVRRNWMGKVLNADIQVIQWARDCMPENLRTFNIISYENLSRVPKDSKFFKCPICDFVVCSPVGCEYQPCPKCNENRIKKAKKANHDAKLRKYKTQGGKVVDERVSTGNIIVMDQIEKVHTKISKQLIGYEKKYDDYTGQTTRVPIYSEKERKPHLRWTFSNLLRNRFNCIVLDETNYVNNPKSNRSVALFNLVAKRRIGLTGTLLRGYPRSACNILNFVFKRSVFPDYRADGKSLDAGVKRFERKYATMVEREGKAPKLVPKINQPEMFQQELSPLVIRHLRHEPNVAKYIPPRDAAVDNKIVPMDSAHRAYYQNWLDVFAEWWRLKRIEEDGQEAALVNDLLVKMGYLINASSIPHFMLDNLEGGDGAAWAKVIGRYTNPSLTQKFLKTTKMIEKYVELGDKTMIGCSRVKNLMLGMGWCKNHDPKINAIRIDGAVSNQIKEGFNRSEKQIRVDKFRHQDYHVLWAGIQTMKEGYNIPEANHAVFMDWTWEPADTEQFIARMLRPAQKKEVTATFMCHEGTVDEYMAALVQLKWRSAKEGVDFESFSDFTADMIPDFTQYANSIVDGTEKELRTQMWTDLDRLKKEMEQYDDEDAGADGNGRSGKEDIEGDDNNGKKGWDDDSEDAGEDWKNR